MTRQAPATGSPVVRETDPTDDEALAAWHAVERSSVRAGDATAAHRSLEALTASVRPPSPRYGRVLLAAHDAHDDHVLGVAELEWPLTTDAHLCSTEIHVHPDVRRRGVGRALWTDVDRRRGELGRPVVEAEIDVPAAAQESGVEAAGPAFARALGFDEVHVEDHLVLALPVDDEHLRRLADAATASAAGYEIVGWQGRCPDHLVEAYAAMRTRMAADVPAGESSRSAQVWDVARVRESEERLAASYDTLVSAARRTSDGELGGYSLVFCDRQDDEAIQDDTLVMPEHRGRRLGTLLKVANLEVLAEDFADRRILHTWTAPDNAPMQAVNRAFGFVATSRSHQVERDDL